MRIDFEARGFKELERALIEELPKTTAKNAMKGAAIESMKPIEDRAKELAPKEDGELADSITTKVVKAKRVSRTEYAAQSGVTVATGPTSRKADDPGGNAAWQEFGTVHMPANPFMRPAADGQQETVIELLAEKLAARLEKAKARIARKLARGR